MLQIKSVHSARHMNDEYWEVGREVEKGKVVTDIKDMGAEFPESIHCQYDILVNGKLYLTLINMPVKVYYETEETA